MKKLLCLILASFFFVALCSCDLANNESSVTEISKEESKEETSVVETFEIPDVIGVDEQTAKNVLSSNGFIPMVTYEYDDTEFGSVFKMDPREGQKVSKNSKVTIYVSKGPSYITSNHSTISWYDISSKEDKWQFYSPYIKEGVLYIECTPTFGKAMSWKRYSGGYGFGEASINDTFDKSVPIRIKAQKESFKAKEEQSITLEIPLTDLNVQKPTDIYLELVAIVDGQQKNIKISFTMTW